MYKLFNTNTRVFFIKIFFYIIIKFLLDSWPPLQCITSLLNVFVSGEKFSSFLMDEMRVMENKHTSSKVTRSEREVFTGNTHHKVHVTFHD